MATLSKKRRIGVFTCVWLMLFIGTVVWRTVGHAETQPNHASQQEQYYAEVVRTLSQKRLDSQPIKSAGHANAELDQERYPKLFELFGDALADKKEQIYRCLNESLSSSEQTEYVDLSFEVEESSNELGILTNERSLKPIHPVIERSTLGLDLATERCLRDVLDAVSFKQAQAPTPSNRIFYRFCINRRVH